MLDTNPSECRKKARTPEVFFVPSKKVTKVGMMNIKLSNEDKRNDILVHICKISELDICLFVDTGFNKMGI